MFGLKRRRAVTIAVQAVAPLIRTQSVFSELPAGFWQDSYVLGYLSGCIIWFANGAYGGFIQGEDLGTVMVSVLRQLNPSEAIQIADRIIDLQRSDDSDYGKGFCNAGKAIAVSYGATDLEGDADVKSAREFALAMRGPLQPHADTNAEVGGALHHLLFHQVVRRRLVAK